MRALRLRLPDPRKQLETGWPRQVVIDRDQVRTIGCPAAQSLVGVTCGDDLVPIATQRVAELELNSGLGCDD